MSEETKSVQFVKGTQYVELPKDPITWLVQGILPAGGMCNLYGPAKLGKSYAALQMAHAIANPKVEDWLGNKVNRHGPVAYLQVDTPRSMWIERVNQLTEHLGYNFEDVYFSDTLLIPRHPFNILSSEDFEALRRGMDAIRPLAVVIDTLREVHEEDEDKATSMKRVVAGLYNATKPAAVLLVSHSRKDHPERGDDVVGDQRGSNYVAGRMDCVIKQTPKRMLVKSRSLLNEKIACHQDKGRWGEIVRDPDEQEMKILNKAMRAKGTQAEKAAMIMQELACSYEQAIVKLEKHIDSKMKDVRG